MPLAVGGRDENLRCVLVPIATTADAAPVYLKCEGKEYRDDPSDAKPVTISIKIDGTNVWVEDGLPSVHYGDDGDIWTFGNETTTTETHTP